MKITQVILALAIAGAPGVQAAHMKSIKMEVHGLVCAFCAQGIEKKLRSMAPTQDVYVSLEHKLVAVTLKDGQDIADATLSESLKDAGYDVKSIARGTEHLDAIRKASKAK